MLESYRIIVVTALLGGVGTALLLSNFRWFNRVSLTSRLMPFAGGVTPARPSLSKQSIIRLTLPRFARTAERIAKSMGVDDPLPLRLQRARWTIDSQAFRLRQLGWSSAALGIALIASIAFHLPLPIILLALVGLPSLGFLALEQQLNNAIKTQQQTLFQELPVVSEQLAMLLSAGYSVGGALTRLSERNSGISGQDLRHICDRIRLGLSAGRALREWADVAGVAEVDHLVAVLTLSDETADVGRLVTDEAATIRREAQRRLVETIEKRGQQVWIPVTVATLVPGVIFLIIPFLQALQIFSAS